MGGCARIEVRHASAPHAPQVVRDLRALPGGVRFVEPMAADMESTLLALARSVSPSPSHAGPQPSGS